jgi:hypothetical protein
MGRRFSSPDGLNYRSQSIESLVQLKFQLTKLPVRPGFLPRFQICNDQVSPLSPSKTYLENRNIDGNCFTKTLIRCVASLGGGRLKCWTSFALTSPDALNDTPTGAGSEALVKILSHGGSQYLTAALL